MSDEGRVNFTGDLKIKVMLPNAEMYADLKPSSGSIYKLCVIDRVKPVVTLKWSSVPRQARFLEQVIDVVVFSTIILLKDCLSCQLFWEIWRLKMLYKSSIKIVLNHLCRHLLLIFSRKQNSASSTKKIFRLAWGNFWERPCHSRI